MIAVKSEILMPATENLKSAAQFLVKEAEKTFPFIHDVLENVRAQNRAESLAREYQERGRGGIATDLRKIKSDWLNPPLKDILKIKAFETFVCMVGSAVIWYSTVGSDFFNEEKSAMLVLGCGIWLSACRAGAEKIHPELLKNNKDAIAKSLGPLQRYQNDLK